MKVIQRECNMDIEKKVLIVEDEAIIALCLKHELESCGFNVLEPVATGEEAVASILSGCPELILLDIRLAGKMTGLDVAKSEECKKTKLLIFMTGYITPEIKKEAMKLNPTGFLEKPVEVNDILKILKNSNF